MNYVIIDVKKLIAEAEKLSKSEHTYWSRGVVSLIRDYAKEVLQEHDGETVSNKELFKLWSCGAETLKDAVYGGCFDIWNYDIAKRLCTPSEFKRSKEGMRNPNRCETWLDVEYRAIYRAVCLTYNILELTANER